MRNERLTLIAWFCLGLIGLNGAAELYLMGRSAWSRMTPPEVSEAVDNHEHGASCHEEESVASTSGCPHCTAACETGAGHVCGMDGGSTPSGGIVFGIPHCQGIPPSSPDYVPASLAFVFLPIQSSITISFSSPRIPIIGPSFDFADFNFTPPSPPPEFTIA